MCVLTYFERKDCKHVWAIITEPCQPLVGFDNCPSFGDGTVKKTPDFFRTRSRPCPRCHLGGVYDRNLVRMVEAMGYGIKWGVGPRKEDWGIEVKVSRGACVIL